MLANPLPDKKEKHSVIFLNAQFKCTRWVNVSYILTYCCHIVAILHSAPPSSLTHLT